MLRQHFNTQESAASLITLGDASYIQADKVCAYHRDRGDSWDQTKPRITHSERELIALAQTCDADYLYTFEDLQWSSQKLRT